jgi:RNA-directed DNA methylation 1
MYQAYMKHIPVPTVLGSQVPFTSWQGLADSLKALYHQPLHYLTNLQLRQWDRLRQGSLDDNTCVRLDDLIHPVKAEALVWLMEETHRLTASPLILTKIWASDAFYHTYIDSIFP